MSDREEWGPWIEHDGKGCPCVGMWVQVAYDDPQGSVIEVRMGGGFNPQAWDWSVQRQEWWKIIRYRIRKPRGLTMLQDLIADLPQPAAPRVDA